MDGRSGNQWPNQQMGGYHQGMMQQQQSQGQQHGWQGQPGGGVPPPPPPGPAPPPPRPPSNGTWAPQVSLQPHHWQHQQQRYQHRGQQPNGAMYPHPSGNRMMHPNMAAGQYMQPAMMMHPGHFQQHFQQQLHAQGGGSNYYNQQQAQMQQQEQQQQRHNQNQRQNQPGLPGNANNKRTNPNNNATNATNINKSKQNDNGSGVERPSLSLPPAKRQRKKDIVPPLEKITVEPTVREPINDAERAEVEAWKAERRKHWPSEDNISRKEQEYKARHARGELDPTGGDDEKISRKTRLQEILQKQRAMGLSKQAGTEDMLLRLNKTGNSDNTKFSGDRGGGRGRGRGGGRGGRGGEGGGRGSRDTRGRGRHGAEYGYQSFLDAGDAPQIDPGLEKWRQRQEENKDQKKDAFGGASVGDQLRMEHDAGGVLINDNKAIKGTRNEVNEAENQRELPTASDNPAVAVNEDGGDGHRQQQQQQQETATIPSGGRGRERGGGGRDRGRGGRNTGCGRGRGRDSTDSRQQNNRPARSQEQPHPRFSSAHQTEPSLLEKLLSREIRQDMSYILQAFRFFVMNNFFQGQQAQQAQAQGEAEIVFPLAAVEADAMMAMKDTSLGAVSDVKKPTVEDILKNKEGIDIDLTDDEEEDDEVIEKDIEGESEPSSGGTESESDEDGTAVN